MMDAQYITIPALTGPFEGPNSEFYFNVNCTKEFTYDPDEGRIKVLNYRGDLISIFPPIEPFTSMRDEDVVDILNTLLIEAKLRPGNHLFGEVSKVPIAAITGLF